MYTKRSSSSRKGRSSVSGLAALLAIGMMMAFSLAAMPVAANIADGAKPDGNTKCLKCHSKSLKKSMEDGEKLSLHVSSGDFSDSAHGAISCTGCHQEIADRKHPKEKITISSKRDYSVAQNQACSSCHEEKAKQYEGSIHASLVAEGNHSAPVCTDCHSAHATQTMALYEPVTGEACKSCHEGIFDAYTQSVHGEARANGNVIRASDIQAPICADCHRAHDVNAVAAGDLVQTTCLSCHEKAGLAHRKWLPNADHHLEVVSCAACHAPMADRRIDLQLVDNATQAPLGQDENHKPFQNRLEQIEEGTDNLDPVELWKLVRHTNQEGEATDVTLRGRMEVSTGADAHRLAIKSSAIRECESCHEQGSAAFENVTVSVNRPDGRKQRFEADKDVLTSVVSVDTVGGFYAPGGTRIKLLDGLLIMGILGGVAIPIGHITLGKILRRKK